MPPKRSSSAPEALLFHELPEMKEEVGSLEAWARGMGYQKPAGVDEAGRGPLAGPVVAAAVMLNEADPIAGLNDSKKLTPRKRDALFDEIRKRCLAFGIGVMTAQHIDALNIRVASLAAMRLAFEQMMSRGVVPDVVMVDGRDTFPWPSGLSPLNQKPFVHGDARSWAVAAASILAKVHRDRMMEAYHARWPQYGFGEHKGYGTQAHLASLREFGPCEIHRLTFRGVC